MGIRIVVVGLEKGWNSGFSRVWLWTVVVGVFSREGDAEIS